MGLTETKNRQLGTAIMVDPSLISRLRTGKRKPPSNAEYIKTISEYFAVHCQTPLQREAITRVIGESHIDFSDKEKTTQTIKSWLTSDELMSQSYGSLLLQTFDSIKLSIGEEFAEEIFPLQKNLNYNKQIVYTYYGNEGKQLATSLLFQMVLSAKKASEIKILTGNTTGWLWKDRAYSEQVSNNIKKVVLEGHTITRIVPRNQNLNMAFDSVTRWLPLYVTGRVHSYYYPYLRDQIFNRTLYVVPGIAALVSTSVENKTEGGLTLLTTNPDMIKSLEAEFDNYMELCLPAITFYDYSKTETELLQCVSSFYAYQADCINILGGLSYITTPKEVMLDFVQRFVNFDTPTLIERFETEFAELDRLLQRYTYTEIICIDSFEDIISGKARSCAISGETFVYTPNAYRKHLKKIISMLEIYDNYHVIIVEDKKVKSTFYIKKGYAVLAFLSKAPYLVCDCKNLEMVAAVWEYTNKETEIGVTLDINKKQVITRINHLILQLEDYS